MLKRAMFALLLIALATAVAGTAMAAGSTRPAASPAGLHWNGGGGRALPRLAATFGRTASPTRALFEFPSEFQSPVNRYDWSRWFGWLNRPT